MKKVIAAAAGLMIAGSAMVASAAVEFSGDARARYQYFDIDENGAKSSKDAWSHRVRMNIDATNAGGSFAKVRLRMDDNGWNSGNASDNDGNYSLNQTINDTEYGSVNVEYAYIGVPMGCTLLTAGRQPLALTTSYFYDSGVDNARVTWSNEGTTLVGLYGVITDGRYSDSVFEAVTGVEKSGEQSDLEKDDMFSVAWMQAWNENWASTVALSYANFDRTNYAYDLLKDEVIQEGKLNNGHGGFMGVIAVDGQAGPVALDVELGYQDQGVSPTDSIINDANTDDAFGIYATAGMDFDALGVTLVGAYGQEGYVFDNAVGFLLIAGDGQLSYIDYVGDFTDFGAEGGADTALVALKADYQATDDLSFFGNLAYVNAQAPMANASDLDIDAWEISGQANYAINDGTVFIARAGYLTVDAAENDTDVLAAGVSLEIKF